MKKVQKTIDENPSLIVPKHLRNAPAKLMKDLGYGKGSAKELGFIPPELADERFYQD